MDEITAVLNKKIHKTNWGFDFNTDIQGYVESAMHFMHYNAHDYYLCYTKDKPEGVFNKIKINLTTNKEGITYPSFITIK